MTAGRGQMTALTGSADADAEGQEGATWISAGGTEYWSQAQGGTTQERRYEGRVVSTICSRR
jgi:hypothetical protein